MHINDMDATLTLGQQGRLVIPAAIRRALGLAPGDQLRLHAPEPGSSCNDRRTPSMNCARWRETSPRPARSSTNCWPNVVSLLPSE